MKLCVDKSKCIGCGVCTDMAEKALEIKQGHATPIEEADLEKREILESAKLAIEVCPMQAIRLKIND